MLTSFPSRLKTGTGCLAPEPIYKLEKAPIKVTGQNCQHNRAGRGKHLYQITDKPQVHMKNEIKCGRSLRLSNIIIQDVNAPIIRGCQLRCLLAIATKPGIIKIILYGVQDGSSGEPLLVLLFCLTTGPKPPPKRCLHIVRSRASYFK